jgi:hypothetical protein
MIRKDICDCINSEDKDPLMLALNRSIENEEEQITEIKTAEEKARKLILNEKAGSDMHAFYQDTINISGNVQKLHEDTIDYYNRVKTKLENTKLCGK